MLEGPLAALDAIEKATGEREVNVDRLLPRRHAARRDARVHGGEEGQAHRQRDVHDVADRLHRAPASSRCSSTRSRSHPREEDERARLSRRQRDGDHLQHAARQRPDLVVRHQQLPARQRPVPVRPAALELRLDAHAGDDAQLLPAQHVHEEPAARSPAASRSPACRSTCRRSRCRPISSPRSRTTSRRGRRPTPGRSCCGGKSRFVLSGSGHIAGMVNPPAANKYGYWTNDKLPADAGRLVRGRQAARRLVVDRLARVGRRRTSAARCRRAFPARASSRCIEAAPGTLRAHPRRRPT